MCKVGKVAPTNKKIVKNLLKITGLYLSYVYLGKYLERLHTRSKLISLWLIIFFMNINLVHKSQPTTHALQKSADMFTRSRAEREHLLGMTKPTATLVMTRSLFYVLMTGYKSRTLVVGTLQRLAASGVTIGPADPALQGAPFQGGAKLFENVGHFSENLTVVLAKVRVLG